MATFQSSRFVVHPQLCVARQISACSICRGKKIKCDGLVPVCTPCQRSRRESECTTGSDKFARGKERSYVTALETHLNSLEKMIAQAKDHRSAEPARATIQFDTARATKGQRKEESHVNELVSDFGFLSVNATSRDFDGLAQDVFAQLILSPSTVVQLPMSDVDVLPSRPTVTSLLQYYIDHDLALYPFMSEAKIFGSVEALYEGYASPFDEWTVYMILATALASLSTSPEDGSYAEAVHYAGAVQKHAKMVLLPGSLQAIQMMLLLVQYSMQDPHHLDSWYLVGAAARMMVDLGLHQDPPTSVKMKDAQLDLRRRIFHSVYSFDRATTLVHQRSFSFTDDSTNVVLPKLSNAVFSNLAKSRNLSLEMIGLRQAASAPYQLLFRSGPDILQKPWPVICAAHQAFSEWESQLHQAKVQGPFKLSFRSEMLYTKILLLSPTRLKQQIEDYGQLRIFDHAVAYSRTLSALVNDRAKATICTSYDILRTIFVVQRLLEVCEQHAGICFGDCIPHPPHVSESKHSLPLLTARTGRERRSLAIEALQLLDGIVRILGKKYGISNAWRELEPRVHTMQTSLQDRAI
ncbi:MAG: hypothetical protein Q9179_002834 [Wetmoreana sp. 5 TL-2023]